MSFIDKIKKFFSEEEPEKNKEDKEKVKWDFNLGEIEYKLDEKLKTINEKRDKIKEAMINRVQQFNSEIKEQIRVLEMLDVDKIREREHFKAIVKDGIKGYIENLKTLSEDLWGIEDSESKEYIQRTGEFLIRFGKFSKSNYERATILIGKDMAKAREIVSNFVRELNEIAKENLNFSLDTKKIDEIKKILDDLDKLKGHEENSEKNKEELKKRVERLKEEKAKTSEEIKELEKSERHKKDVIEKASRKHDLDKLEREISLIKQRIDFKALAKQVYGDNKTSKIVKDYSEDFRGKIESDDNLEITKIVKESSGESCDRLKEIKTKIEEIKKAPVLESEIKERELKNKLEKIEHEIIEFEAEIEHNSKVKEIFAEKREKLIQEIKERFEHLY